MGNKLRLDFIFFYVLIGSITYLALALFKNFYASGVFS